MLTRRIALFLIPVVAIAAFFLTGSKAIAQDGSEFLAAVDYSFDGPSATSVKGGDFNNDGKLDVVTMGPCSSATLPACPASGFIVALYLGNGDGSFQAPLFTATTLTGYMRAIAVGDFNNDGNMDLIVSDETQFTVFLGNGDGTFVQGAQYALGGPTVSSLTIAVADLNGDGKLDLAIGETNYGGNVQLGNMAIYLGDGAGNFATPINNFIAGFDGQYYPAVADFNGDGKLDIVAVNPYSPNGIGTSSLAFLKGNGDGTFQTPTTTELPLFQFAGPVVAADFNGDGKIDLAISAYTLTLRNTLGILQGNGDGTFQPPVQYNAGGSIAIAQFRPGGLPDLVAEDITAGTVILLNKGDGTFQLSPSYATGVAGTGGFVTGDLNLDGKTDIVAAAGATLGVLLGNGDGTMQAAVPETPGYPPQFTVVADMDNDGINDLVSIENCFKEDCALNEGGIMVQFGLGNGQYTAPHIYPGVSNNATGLAVADLNGDGYLDVVVNGGVTYLTGTLGVLLNTGDGSLGAPTAYPLPGPVTGAPAVGDFAGNHKLGVAVVLSLGAIGATPGIGILVGNGDGTLRPPVFTPTTELVPSQVAIGDFNKDGKADVAATGFMYYLQGKTGVTVFLGNGDGTLTVKPNPDHNPATNYFCSGSTCTYPLSYPSQGRTGSLGRTASNQMAIADLNGDGIPDMVLANECNVTDQNCGAGNLVWYYGNGDGTFNSANYSSPKQQIPGAIYTGVSVADLNGDGKPDIVAATPTEVAVFLAPYDSGTLYASSSFNFSEAPSIADLNGDGAPDIAINDGTHVDLLFNRFPAPPAATATTLSSSTNPSLFGAPVKFTATVTSSAGTPIGSVTFVDGSTTLATLKLTDGAATYRDAALAAGTHMITAVFDGIEKFQASTSAPLTQVVLGKTVTTLTSLTNPTVYGSVATLTATVTSDSVAPADGELITFKQGVTILGTAPLSGGSATLKLSSLSVGSHSIVAAYPGDASLARSASAIVTQVVGVASTRTALHSGLNPSRYNQAVALIATVSSGSGTVIPTGIVSFYEGSTKLGMATLVGGVATFTISTLPDGTAEITATYDGSSSFTGSTSPFLGQVVYLGPTKTTLAANPNPSDLNQPISFTAIVTPVFGGTVTGSVTFMDGSTTLGTAGVSDRLAFFKTSTLSTGMHTITAVYRGSSEFAPSSGSLELSVK